jgi:acyl carrier protein
MTVLSYDEIVSIIRSEIAEYYDGQFNNDDHFVRDLRIASDDLSAAALSLEKRFGIRLSYREYQQIGNVSSYAKMLLSKLATSPADESQ